MNKINRESLGLIAHYLTYKGINFIKIGRFDAR